MSKGREIIKDNNIQNGMKIFFDGDGEWYASPFDIKKTKEWVISEFGYGEELELEECDLDKNGAWVITEDEEHIKALGDSSEISFGKIGDLRISRIEYGKVDRLTSFREILKKDGHSKEPYEIASTYN